MHPILREAEAAFRQVARLYRPEEIPALREAHFIVPRHDRGAAECRIHFHDGREIRFAVPRITWQMVPSALLVPSALRGGDYLVRELGALWARIAAEDTVDERPMTVCEGWDYFVNGNPPEIAPIYREIPIRVVDRIVPPETPPNIFRDPETPPNIFRDMADTMDGMLQATMYYGADPGRIDQGGRCDCPGCRQQRRWDERHANADARSLDLLRAWLSGVQLSDFNYRKSFDVTGSSTGKRYRIEIGRSFNVTPLDKDGKPQPRLCFAPAGIYAVGDIMLAQKIALETDEKAALKVANVERPRLAIFEANQSPYLRRLMTGVGNGGSPR